MGFNTWINNYLFPNKMVTGINGIELIKKCESSHDDDSSIIGLQPKMCPKGIWTQGFGHAIIYNGKQLTGIENKELAYSLFTLKDEKEAEELLKKDLKSFEKQLDSLKMNLNQNQYDSLISWIFNLGFQNFKESTLYLKLYNGDKDNFEPYLNPENMEINIDLKKQILMDYKMISPIQYNFLRWSFISGKFYRGLYFRRKEEFNLYTA